VEVNSTVQDVTGRPPRTLARFLADYTDAFCPESQAPEHQARPAASPAAMCG
jgi:hypothetical protein